MVASMSRGKKAYLQYEAQLSAAVEKLNPLREELKVAIDADAEAYNSVMKAYKLAKTVSEKEGEALIDTALKQATSVPLSVAEKAQDVARDCGQSGSNYESEYEIGLDDGAGAGAGCNHRGAGKC